MYILHNLGYENDSILEFLFSKQSRRKLLLKKRTISLLFYKKSMIRYLSYLKIRYLFADLLAVCKFELPNLPFNVATRITPEVFRDFKK